MIEILKRPIVTEKMTALGPKGHYAFEVNPRANKIEISRAIEKKFNVTVVSVRTMCHKGKTKSQLTRRGRFAGRTPGWKKAIVRLKDGETIDFFQGI